MGTVEWKNDKIRTKPWESWWTGFLGEVYIWGAFAFVWNRKKSALVPKRGWKWLAIWLKIVLDWINKIRPELSTMIIYFLQPCISIEYHTESDVFFLSQKRPTSSRDAIQTTWARDMAVTKQGLDKSAIGFPQWFWEFHDNQWYHDNLINGWFISWKIQNQNIDDN